VCSKLCTSRKWDRVKFSSSCLWDRKCEKQPRGLSIFWWTCFHQNKIWVKRPMDVCQVEVSGHTDQWSQIPSDVESFKEDNKRYLRDEELSDVDSSNVVVMDKYMYSVLSDRRYTSRMLSNNWDGMKLISFSPEWICCTVQCLKA
jgi:hypothetical protein